MAYEPDSAKTNRPRSPGASILPLAFVILLLGSFAAVLMLDADAPDTATGIAPAAPPAATPAAPQG